MMQATFTCKHFTAEFFLERHLYCDRFWCHMYLSLGSSRRTGRHGQDKVGCPSDMFAQSHAVNLT